MYFLYMQYIPTYIENVNELPKHSLNIWDAQFAWSAYQPRGELAEWDKPFKLTLVQCIHLI